MAGGLAPVLSPAYFSPQHPPSSKSLRIQNQALSPLVTLLVFLRKHCSSCHFPHFDIHTVTNFLNRNILGTAEGLCLPLYFGGGRACPAYRLYPAWVSTQLQLPFKSRYSQNFLHDRLLRQIHTCRSFDYVLHLRTRLSLATALLYALCWYVSLLSAPHRTQACHGLCRAEIRGYCVVFSVYPAGVVPFPYGGLRRKTPA